MICLGFGFCSHVSVTRTHSFAGVSNGTSVHRSVKIAYEFECALSKISNLQMKMFGLTVDEDGENGDGRRS